MSKRGKKGSHKRVKNAGKSTKHGAKQPRMDQPSTHQEHAIPPVQVTNTGPRKTETTYPNIEQLTIVQKSELLSKDLKPGESILARYLSVDPSVSLRNLEPGPSTSSQDAGVDEYMEESPEGPLDLSVQSEEGPINLTKDSVAGTSEWSSDMEARPSDWSREPVAGPSNWMPEQGSSDWTRDEGPGSSTRPSESGAVPSNWSRDMGAGPSVSSDSGEGSSTQLNRVLISSLDYDPNLKSSIVASFLGIPKCIRDAQEREAAEAAQAAALEHERKKYNTDEDSDSGPRSDPVPCDFIIPSSRLKRKISSEESRPSTTKDEQVSSPFLDKSNGNERSLNSSSISEKAAQEAVVSTIEILADSVQKFKISTTNRNLEIRHVQDIEHEILQQNQYIEHQDIERVSNNSPDFGRDYIQRLAASLLESDKPVVFDDNRLPVWPKKKSRVPYVFLHPPFEFRNHMRSLLERNIQFYLPKRGTHYTKILSPSFEDQKNIVQYFNEYGMPYHTFGFPSEKMMRVVIKGLSGDIDLDILKEELVSASIPVVRLHKMRYNGMHMSRWHIVLAIVPQNEEGLRLLKVRKILGQEVSFERAKSKTKQCHRCQKWGHAQRFCKGRENCVKCAGDHSSAKCTKDLQVNPPKCANCGGGHTASYRLCVHCPDSEAYKSWQMKKISHNHKFPRVLATLENCSMLFDSNK